MCGPIDVGTHGKVVEVLSGTVGHDVPDKHVVGVELKADKPFGVAGDIDIVDVQTGDGGGYSTRVIGLAILKEALNIARADMANLNVRDVTRGPECVRDILDVEIEKGEVVGAAVQDKGLTAGLGCGGSIQRPIADELRVHVAAGAIDASDGYWPTFSAAMADIDRSG
ncbi:hypothetical protein OCOJLMKI_5328 [Methylobacterium iners]|uniref:Aldehyde oxidase/xanthine dehydrogenase second molybdopterin binding domain-containing protein n=1 Tax=Methylobacterium iners TaxID=418707 RepID=A0ABQ4S6H5_9HYPH|nr:hypothetical protein OCOJLMKI_5328 [Methylobacterium iners]